MHDYRARAPAAGRATLLTHDGVGDLRSAGTEEEVGRSGLEDDIRVVGLDRGPGHDDQMAMHASDDGADGPRSLLLMPLVAEQGPDAAPAHQQGLDAGCAHDSAQRTVLDAPQVDDVPEDPAPAVDDAASQQLTR